jgi:transcriptional regulator
MYTPKFNQVTDRSVLIEAMRAYSFAILFGPQLQATHLPLMVKEEDDRVVLLGHFALANPHWTELSGRETLVIFPGPHCYVSPSFYTETLSVPTWNYIAIHAYGVLELVEDEAGKAALVEELIQVHEPAYLEKWRAMSEVYRRNMLTGIMGFRIPVVRIEGKFKISQNRGSQERSNVHAAHAAGSDDQRELARWMERLKPQA